MALKSFMALRPAWFLEMFNTFYLAKNLKIAKNSTTKAKEQISTDLESLEFLNLFDVRLN